MGFSKGFIIWIEIDYSHHLEEVSANCGNEIEGKRIFRHERKSWLLIVLTRQICYLEISIQIEYFSVHYKKLIALLCICRESIVVIEMSQQLKFLFQITNQKWMLNWICDIGNSYWIRLPICLESTKLQIKHWNRLNPCGI